MPLKVPVVTSLSRLSDLRAAVGSESPGPGRARRAIPIR